MSRFDSRIDFAADGLASALSYLEPRDGLPNLPEVAAYMAYVSRACRALADAQEALDRWEEAQADGPHTR